MVNIYRKASELIKTWQASYCMTSDDGGKVEKAIIALLEPLLNIENATIDCCDAVAEQSVIDTEGSGQILIDVELLEQIRDVAADGAAGITTALQVQYIMGQCETIEKLAQGALPVSVE